MTMLWRLNIQCVKIDHLSDEIITQSESDSLTIEILILVTKEFFPKGFC